MVRLWDADFLSHGVWTDITMNTVHIDLQPLCRIIEKKSHDRAIWKLVLL